MFILGFMVGLVVGFFIAVLVLGLCMAAREEPGYNAVHAVMKKENK